MLLQLRDCDDIKDLRTASPDHVVFVVISKGPLLACYDRAATEPIIVLRIVPVLPHNYNIRYTVARHVAV
jgi:hypothetical protein